MTNHVNTIWTGEQEEALKGFIADGLTYQRAANELNDKFDTKFTRCAATGKAFRLRIKSPDKPKLPPKPREPQIYKPRPKRPPPLNMETLHCQEIVPRNLSLLQLKQNDCRWPYGDGPFVYCGHRQLEGSSYCPGHYALSVGHGTTSERRASQMVAA